MLSDVTFMAWPKGKKKKRRWGDICGQMPPRRNHGKHTTERKRKK